jgi:hypothetical protein
VDTSGRGVPPTAHADARGRKTPPQTAHNHDPRPRGSPRSSTAAPPAASATTRTPPGPRQCSPKRALRWRSATRIRADAVQDWEPGRSPTIGERWGAMWSFMMRHCLSPCGDQDLGRRALTAVQQAPDGQRFMSGLLARLDASQPGSARRPRDRDDQAGKLS